METEKTVEYSADVLEELRKYESHEEVQLCLECGYSGLMGLVREEIPWFVSWWILIPVFLILGGSLGGYGLIGAFIAGVVLQIIRSAYRKRIVVCPKCKNSLTLK